jgi:hypothetical protein
MDTRVDDQQPFARTVGRREASPIGMVPTREARAAWDSMSNAVTGAPKGLFRYDNHAEMTRDREAWAAAAMVGRARSGA